MKDKVITCHIGGRAGSIGFPDFPNFKNEIKHIIFDADDTCIDQIKDKWDNADVFPYFIGDTQSEVQFIINYCPYTSSVYNFNEKYKNYYFESGKTDYVLGNVTKTQKKINIETKSLDYLVNNNLIPKPNFLSIDTQGSEFHVLKGAENLLKDSIVAVSTEINFQELYKGSILFTEIDNFMKKNDFILVEISSFNLGNRRIHREFRGKGIPLQGEAMYFKNPETLIKKLINPRDLLFKLAFVSLAFGYTEFSFDTLKKIKDLNKISSNYQNVLIEFMNKIDAKNILPPLWDKVYTFEDSNNRFSNLNKNNIINKQKLINRVINKLSFLLNKLFSLLYLEIKFNPKNNNFEKFLLKNNFMHAVNEIRKRKNIN